MKLFTKNLIIMLFAVLLMANVMVFLNSLTLGDKINDYEKKIKSLKQENLTLQNKVDEVNSLRYAAAKAEEMNFVKKAQPEYLENLKYARSQ